MSNLKKYYKSLILIGLFLISTNLFSEDWNKNSFELKATSVKQESATAKSALQLRNTQFLNHSLQGITRLNFSTSDSIYIGQGLEFSWRPNFNIFRPSLFLSYNDLKKGTGMFSMDIHQYQYDVKSPSNSYRQNNYGLQMHNQSTLKTVTGGLIVDVHIFKGRKESFLEGIGIRGGLIGTGEALTFLIPYGLGGTNVSDKNNNYSTSGLRFNNDRVYYNTAGSQVIVGASYFYRVKEKHIFDVAYELYNGQARGDYRTKGMYPGQLMGFLIPVDEKYKGETKLTISGSRYTVGYKYNLSEALAFRFSFAETNMEQKMNKSTIQANTKSSDQFMAFAAENMIGMFISTMKPLGPYNTFNDKKQEFSAEVIVYY